MYVTFVASHSLYALFFMQHFVWTTISCDLPDWTDEDIFFRKIRQISWIVVQTIIK